MLGSISYIFEKDGGNVHEKIKDSISRELVHVSIRLPLLGCGVHVDQLCECSDHGKNQ